MVSAQASYIYFAFPTVLCFILRICCFNCAILATEKKLCSPKLELRIIHFHTNKDMFSFLVFYLFGNFDINQLLLQHWPFLYHVLGLYRFSVPALKGINVMPQTRLQVKDPLYAPGTRSSLSRSSWYLLLVCLFSVACGLSVKVC